MQGVYFFNLMKLWYFSISGFGYRSITDRSEVYWLEL